MSKILTFTPFLAKTFVSKRSSSVKNHRRDMFYISKTFSELGGVCEKKNQDRATRRSENIEANVKKYSEKPLKKKVPCIGL